MTPSKHIIHLFFPPLGREMVIVVNISLPSHPRSLRACTALGVGIKGSGRSRDILGCPGSVKDISPLPMGKSPHSSRTRGIQAFTTLNQTLSARPPLPHFGLKSYFWAKFPLCIWEQLYSNLAQRLPCTLTELWPGLPIHSGCCTPFPSQPDGVWAK